MRERKRYRLQGMQSPEDSMRSSYESGRENGQSWGGSSNSITVNRPRNEYPGRYMKSSKDT